MISWIKWFNRRASQEPRDALYKSPILLKRGKWVTAGGRVGILTDVTSSNVVGIDHTNADGFTTDTKYYPVGQVVIAKLAEIPSLRRPLNKDQAHELGYY